MKYFSTNNTVVTCAPSSALPKTSVCSSPQSQVIIFLSTTLTHAHQKAGQELQESHCPATSIGYPPPSVVSNVRRYPQQVETVKCQMRTKDEPDPERTQRVQPFTWWGSGDALHNKGMQGEAIPRALKCQGAGKHTIPLARTDLEDLFLVITPLRAVVKSYTIKRRSQMPSC